MPVTYDQNTFSSADDWEEETTSSTFSLWEDNIEDSFAAVEAYQHKLLVNIEQKKPMKSTSGLVLLEIKSKYHNQNEVFLLLYFVSKGMAIGT